MLETPPSTSATTENRAARRSLATAPASPPAGIRPDPAEFRGPLFEHWAQRMRIDGLVRSLPESLAALRARVGIPSSADRATWLGMDEPTVRAVEDFAAGLYGTPWPQASATRFARYVRDGDRVQYEAAVMARRDRLSAAVVTAAVTDAQEWLDEAADGVVMICEQSTWCWPAHDDAHERRGFVLSDADAPYLDLGAGEVVAQLAVADHVLGERWDASWPGLRERIRREADVRVFTPFESRDDFWWLGFWREVNNWNPWIIGNVLLAAVLLLDDRDRVARIAARALESLDRYVATLPEDGAIDEGVAYWWNGAGRMLECLDLIARITGGDLDASGIPVVREVLRFPMRMHLGGDWYVNVADGPARISGQQPWQLPFRWGTRLGDDRIVAWASAARRPGLPAGDVGSGLPRLLRSLSDAEWIATTPSAPPLPRCVWLPSVQVLVGRAHPGAVDGLTLAAKGGTNGENHNHKDLGSFIVAVDGLPLIVDIGKPTYTAQTFGPDRYGIRAMQSGWHNAPAPFGLEQGDGAGFHADVVRAPSVAAEPGSDPRQGANGEALPIELELELGAAYPLREGDSWRRTFRLASARRIEIDDRWQLHGEPDAPALAHLVVAGVVEAAGTGIRVSRDGAGIVITTSEEVTPTVEVWELDDPELIAVWGAQLTRLTYEMHASAGRLTTIIEEAR